MRFSPFPGRLGSGRNGNLPEHTGHIIHHFGGETCVFGAKNRTNLYYFGERGENRGRSERVMLSCSGLRGECREKACFPRLKRDLRTEKWTLGCVHFVFIGFLCLCLWISPFSDSSPAFPRSTSAAHWRQSRHTLRRRRRICRAGCTWDRSSPGPAPFSRCR